MSILNDPQVTEAGDGYKVAATAGPMHVLPNDTLGWGVYSGPNGDLVTTTQGPLIGWTSAEPAVEAAFNVARLAR